MQYTFSDKVRSLAPSAIREILKFTSMPGVISFAAGNPAPEAFPVDEVRQITAEIMRDNPIDALQYSITEGYTPLRDTVSAYMRSVHHTGTEQDGLIITAGAQQVMDLTCKSLCNEGDTVICEAPTFIGTLNAFRSYNVHLCGVDMEPDGINLEQLEHAMKTEKNVRMLYTIPNFQNPSGITMSLEKRKAVYTLAKKYGVIIVEDNPYGEIRFEGETIPNIKSFDTDGLVVYAGSFSKVLAPGLRLGYAIAPKELLSKVIVCKQVADVHSTILAQMIAHRFMTEYDFAAHLQRIRKIYYHKAHLMMDLADQLFDGKITYHPVQGGLFLWCALPDGVDMMEFCTRAVQQKVAVVPGNAFLVDESLPCQNFRMNFSTPTDEQLEQGMQILGRLSAEL